MHPSQAVDVAKLAQAREIAELNHRKQVYSLATTIMVRNSEHVLTTCPNNKESFEQELRGKKVRLVQDSLELAEIMFAEIEAKEKEHAERRNQELSGTKSALQLP